MMDILRYIMEIIPVFEWLHKKHDDRLKIDVISHDTEDWHVLKGNLFLYDDSLAFKIRGDAFSLQLGFKQASCDFLRYDPRDNGDLQGFSGLFADAIEVAFREYSEKMYSKKMLKKIILKAYKQTDIRWRK